MRITSFWAKGFRSLCDVKIVGLDDFNVFYGPNGSGKTNVLAALRAFFRLVSLRVEGEDDPSQGNVAAANNAFARGVVDDRDFCATAPQGPLVLGATVRLDDPALPEVPQIDVEVELSGSSRSRSLRISRLTANGEDLLARYWGTHSGMLDEMAKLRATRESLTSRLRGWERTAYGLIEADRALRDETYRVPEADVQDEVTWHLKEGRLKSALFVAQTGTSYVQRNRIDALRALLGGPPLHRPPFIPVKDRSGYVELRERMPEPNPEGREIVLHLAGLGIVQIYGILASALFLGARAVGIEEPEAHLHAPTTGRALRQLLERLVRERYIDQLFIAKHSNLFDLDPKGYFDVSMAGGCTVVDRQPLDRIDQRHLYEPGPAKHALQQLLLYAPPGDIVFRTPDGEPVTAQAMLEMLQRDDDLAVDFLRSVHGAAVRMVKVANRTDRRST